MHDVHINYRGEFNTSLPESLQERGVTQEEFANTICQCTDIWKDELAPRRNKKLLLLILVIFAPMLISQIVSFILAINRIPHKYVFHIQAALILNAVVWLFVYQRTFAAHYTRFTEKTQDFLSRENEQVFQQNGVHLQVNHRPLCGLRYMRTPTIRCTFNNNEV